HCRWCRDGRGCQQSRSTGVAAEEGSCSTRSSDVTDEGWSTAIGRRQPQKESSFSQVRGLWSIMTEEERLLTSVGAAINCDRGAASHKRGPYGQSRRRRKIKLSLSQVL
ncbi:hypothetical protein GW17_00020601, partial [Ensete ventricosum]